MKRYIRHIPALAITMVAALMLLHGPIAQPAHYHEFADQSLWAGIPHAADVLSNLGFAMVALWGAARLWPQRNHPALRNARVGYGLFLMALLLTSIGSTYYHLAPDDWRLVWDRLPIALACSGLLAGVRAQLMPNVHVRVEIVGLTVLALASVMWWYVGQRSGSGDLRPYLLLQAAPLLLIPVWQTIHGPARDDRLCFGLALALYVLAKIAELHDHEIHVLSGQISGHTIKHLAAAAAAWTLVARLVRSTTSDCAPDAVAPHHNRRRPRGSCVNKREDNANFALHPSRVGTHSRHLPVRAPSVLHHL
jgi:hypothetical protein